MSATAVKERPILFSGEMVRAILAGKKTMTRRVMKPQPTLDAGGGLVHADWGIRHPDGHRLLVDANIDGKFAATCECCPYGTPGERLWVKEKHWRRGVVHRWAGSEPIEPYWRSIKPHEGEQVKPGRYVSFDDEPPQGEGWKRCPSIHLPRWASRITLEIVSVRVERLQSISREDAIAEGISVLPLQSADDPSAWWQSVPGQNQARTPQQSFAKLWQSINGPGSWEANPFVWAISFQRLEPCAP